MKGPVFLAASHSLHHRSRSIVLVACVFVAAALPVASRVLAADLRSGLTARARATPLVAGAKGSRFDLVMSSLYFRDADIGTLSMADWKGFASDGLAVAIPLNSRFRVRGLPLVATSTDYFELRGLRAARGGLPVMIGEAALGANAAAKLGVSIGENVHSDQPELYDISKPASLRMRIVGVLAENGSADDDAVFTDISTAWILEGLGHGHSGASSVPDRLILDRSGAGVVVSEELVDFSEITAENRAAYHRHAAADSLPLTAVILVPGSEKGGAILKARANAGSESQVVVPEMAVGEMLGYVARMQQVLDALAGVIVAFTVVLIGLVTALSVRVRQRELETLSRIGASRGIVALIFGYEIVLVLVIGVGLAGLAGLILRKYTPDLTGML